MEFRKIYLGDGAYCQCDGYGLVITAENGIEATDTVVIEGPGVELLLKYWHEMKTGEKSE